LYHNQKTESFLDTHVKFFEEVVGVYGEMVYGNTKVIVAKFTGPNEKEPAEEFLKLSNNDGIDSEGLYALYKTLKEDKRFDIRIVAPDKESSAVG